MYKEKFEGKVVKIYAPMGGRYLGRLKVSEVINENVLQGTVPESGIDTAYYLSDGIRVFVDYENEVR